MEEQNAAVEGAGVAGDGEGPQPTNGNAKVLVRMETVPDIKKDTSGVTTQYIAAGIVNLGAFASGVCVAWSSAALPLLRTSSHHGNIRVLPETEIGMNSTSSTLEMSQEQASWVAALLCLGAACGAVPAGLVSEYFGRKKTLLYLALPLIVSWILVASSPNVYGLYVGRCVGGVAVGAFSVAVPPYVADVAERHLLPALANFYHVLFACGILFGYIIDLVQVTSWLTALSGSLPVVFFVAFIFLPESPTYLMSQGKTSEAKAALRYFRGIDNDIDAEIKEIKEYIKNYSKNKITFVELFTNKPIIKALFVSFGLMGFQQLSGVYPVLFYAGSIFEDYHVSLAPPAPAIILGFSLVTSTYFATMLLRIIDRRVLLIFSLTSMSVILGVLAIAFHINIGDMSKGHSWLSLLMLCLYVAVYAAGLGPIPWLILREIFPAHAVRRATAISVGFHWFIACGVVKLFPNLVKIVGPGWTLWSFAVHCVLGACFTFFFVPETRGRNLKDIQNEFAGIPKKHRHIIEVESVSEV